MIKSATPRKILSSQNNSFRVNLNVSPRMRPPFGTSWAEEFMNKHYVTRDARLKMEL